jgi:hypothetical protein
MRFFTLRKPPFWSLLFAGLIFGALCVYALKTDTFIVPRSRTHPGKIIFKNQDPEAFGFCLHFSALLFIYSCSIAFIKFVPLEDRLIAWNAKIKIKVEESGAATKPIPAVWAYSFLAGFVIFILYLGYVFMYKE